MVTRAQLCSWDSGSWNSFWVTFCFSEQQEAESGASASAVPKSKPNKKPLRGGGEYGILQTLWAWNRAFIQLYLWTLYILFVFFKEETKHSLETSSLSLISWSALSFVQKLAGSFGSAFPWEKNVSEFFVNCFGIIYWDFCHSELQILTVVLGSFPSYSASSIIWSAFKAPVILTKCRKRVFYFVLCRFKWWKK